MPVDCGSPYPPNPFNEAAPLSISLLGVLSAFVLLFLLGWVLFRRHLAALPSMSKKKIFVIIGIFTLCVGYGISWPVLHDLYQYIAPLASKVYAADTVELFIPDHIFRDLPPTYGDLISICIPTILLLLAVLAGRIGKKLLSPLMRRKSGKIPPVKKQSRRMAYGMYPIIVLVLFAVLWIGMTFSRAILGTSYW